MCVGISLACSHTSSILLKHLQNASAGSSSFRRKEHPLWDSSAKPDGCWRRPHTGRSPVTIHQTSQIYFHAFIGWKDWHWSQSEWVRKDILKFDAYFMPRLMLLVFDRLESVNTALQKKSLQFSQAELIVNAVKETIGQLRNDFSCFWSDVSTRAGEIKVGDLSISKRQRQALYVVMTKDPMHMTFIPRKISAGNCSI